jgi:hypothetical protein
MTIRVNASIVYEGLLVVRASLGGQLRPRLLVDCGASYTALSQEYLRSKPRLKRLPSGRSWRAGTAGATSPVELPTYFVSRFGIGPIVKQDFEIVRIVLPAGVQIDGVLGVNFLRDYRTTTEIRSKAS